MRLTPRRVLLAAFYSGIILLCLLFGAVWRRWQGSPQDGAVRRRTSSQEGMGSSRFLEAKEGGSYSASSQDRRNSHGPRAAVANSNVRCSMTRCFNFTKCVGEFKVHLYRAPLVEGEKTSPTFNKFIGSLQRSRYITDDPDKACIFIPLIDVLDRDILSSNYVFSKAQVEAALSNTPHWNGGTNNLIFNIFSGTFPEYSEFLDFDTGKAILAKTSFSLHSYRPNFDVSLPLIGKRHPEKSGVPSMLQSAGNLFPVQRKYLVTFKGKRYVYGVGSETRNALGHLHNGKDFILLTTCQHGTSWTTMQDWRCAADNKLYTMYDFEELMVNSTFCLVPRGRRLGSYRLLEVLQAGCIPVTLSNGYILPFQEVIDWGQAALVLDERALFQLPFIIRAVPKDKVFQMRLQLDFLWERYFSTVQSIVDTTLEIIHQRVKPHLKRNQQMWNRYPGGLAYDITYGTSLGDFPFLSPHVVLPSAEAGYTVVVRASGEVTPDSPLSQLIVNLRKCWRMKKVIVVWSGSESMPQHHQFPPLPVPIHTVPQPLSKSTVPLWPLGDILTDGVMTVDESVKLISEEIEFAFDVWYHHQSQIVGFYPFTHSRSEVLNRWSLTSKPSGDYSLVHTGVAMFHRYYCHLYATSLPAQTTAMLQEHPHCEDVVLNFLVSRITKKSPILVPKLPPSTDTERAYKESLTEKLREKEDCLNTMVDTFGDFPLKRSILRMNPSLYKTPAGRWRKQYPHLETAQ